MSTHITRFAHAFQTSLYNLGYADPIREMGLLGAGEDNDPDVLMPLSAMVGYADATRRACMTLADIGPQADRQKYLAAAKRAICVTGAFSALVLVVRLGGDVGAVVDASIEMLMNEVDSSTDLG